MKKKFHQTIGIVALLLLSGGTLVHAQSGGGGAPPLPVYTDTGNPAADQARYDNDKVVYTSFFESAAMTDPGAAAEAAKVKAAEDAAAEQLAADIAMKAAFHADTREVISQEAWDDADATKRAYLEANTGEFNLDFITR